MEGTDHMTPIISSKSILVASARKSWAVPLFFIALMGWMTTPTASAGQFNQLAHAKYMFIGVVTEAKVEARADSASGVAEGSKRSSRGINYVKALVSPQKTLTDAPKGPVGSQNVYICAADISVGATYLFILGDPDERRGCFHSVPFLLGALPGKSPNSSIVLTADTIFMMPESPNLDQFPIAMPDANVSGNFCKRKIVVLHSYMDLHVFLRLLKEERAKGTNKNQSKAIKGDGA